MILIGENINIMSKTIGPALRERNPEPIQELAKAEAVAGVDYLDINIGPARSFPILSQPCLSVPPQVPTIYTPTVDDLCTSESIPPFGAP